MRDAITLGLVLCLGACATGDVESRTPDADAGARDVAVQRDTPAPPTDTGAITPTDTGAVTPDDAPPAADAGPRCAADHDGVITRAEINFLVGASVLYAVNEESETVTPVDVTGAMVEGVRRWDYSAPRTEDRRVLDEVIRPTGRWWSGRYPDATFATMLDRTHNILGVYRASATALELLGTVSVAENATNLTMSPPVVVLRFPLRVGDTWTQSVTASGFYNFTPLTNVTAYTSRVDAAGEVWTPAGRYPSLRVRTDLDQTIPFTVIRRTKRTYTFLSECWGVVARLASVDNETADPFTRASEYRRLSL
jgi:hypothetical protein